jgi:phosphoserine phosphatase
MSADPERRVLITVTGRDRPGITAALAEIIAAAGVDILDVQQVVIQELLSLSMVLDYRENGTQGKPVLKDLLFRAKELDLDMNFRVLPAAEVARPRAHHRHVLTLIGHRELAAGAIARVARVLAGHGFNIGKIQRLDEGRIRCLEMVVDAPDPARVEALKADLLPVGGDFAVDLALQPDTLFRRVKRLVVMDLDSTLIQAEAIDELARVAGRGEAVRALTLQAMDGRMDFAEALRGRVALLGGLPVAQLEAVAAALPLTPGADRLIRVLKRLGYRTAIISGGFDFFSERIRARLGIDYAYANSLEVAEGRLTGRVREPIIDGKRKALLLGEIAKQEHLRLDQVIAVGDGANDLPMLSLAGLGIAFNAKPSVRAAAQHSLNQDHLDTILFLLGISQNDVAALEREE